MVADSRDRRPWDAPDCPNGHLHIYVDGYGGIHQWKCFRCETEFDAEVPVR